MKLSKKIITQKKTTHAFFKVVKENNKNKNIHNTKENPKERDSGSVRRTAKLQAPSHPEVSQLRALKS